MSRREQLESMLAEDPGDTFLQYALAMELEQEGEHEASLGLHQKLIQGDPPYVPSFFMAGQQLARLERTDEARQILSQGIDQARQQNDLHAAGEMQGFLDSL